MKVSRNIDLVYGGGSIGLMGLVSQAVHDGGRHVIGYDTPSLFSLTVSLFHHCSFSFFPQRCGVKGGSESMSHHYA